MHIGKRMFIKGGLAFAALVALPRALLAAVWPEKAFNVTTASEAMNELLGSDQTVHSDEISLKAPEIAENGAVVPVKIKTTLKNVQSISIVVEKNPRPLAATVEILPGTLPEFSSRIKMRETSDVTVVVKTDSGLFSTSKEIKVTIGGCGG
ncbi:MAG: thiosulfate oxidation carrier protein SoxY [Gammaproteobacteria bacterium]|nr:MAG: thiosulfate oxidation carrier protein SoxY [Gammaproteobacteria bacterium]